MVEKNEYEDLFQDFLIESTELLNNYEDNLLEIEDALKRDDFSFDMIEERLQAIFRAIHTIKGLSAMMEFDEINRYTHEAEEIFHCARTNEIVIDQSLVDLMFRVLDNTKNLITAVLSPGAVTFDMEKELAELEQFLEKAKSPGVCKEIPDEEEEIDAQIANQPISADTLKTNTIRVDTQRLDMLLDAIGELVIGKNQLMTLSDQIDNTDLSKALKQHKRIIENLQEWSIKLRMVPIGHALTRYKRMVRDLSRQREKEVNLTIEGESTEIDRAIIESLESPLLHILRNSIDHGIEPPDEREKAGKDPVGNLKIKAFEESGSIMIAIEDDGRGIDPDAVYEKAMEKGLIEPSAKLSKSEIYNLLFSPGFSTAEEVTDVSGRGVGMDVVRKNIQRLNGMISIESEVGKGTKFILKLPLTLAIMRAMLVDIAGELFSIPIYNINETLSITEDQIYRMNGYQVAHIRGEALPIVWLNKELNIQAESESEKKFVLVIDIGEKQIGFIVDKLIDHLDIVIKPLGVYMENIPGVSGATILGNGDISLVLDLASVWRNVLERVRQT
jgi:two-component system chemotaxis sensor kinase CheA